RSLRHGLRPLHRYEYRYGPSRWRRLAVGLRHQHLARPAPVYCQSNVVVSGRPADRDGGRHLRFEARRLPGVRGDWSAWIASSRGGLDALAVPRYESGAPVRAHGSHDTVDLGGAARRPAGVDRDRRWPDRHHDHVDLEADHRARRWAVGGRVSDPEPS